MNVQPRNKNAIFGSEFRKSINGALEERAALGILTMPVFERLHTCSLRNLVRVNEWTEIKKVVVTKRMWCPGGSEVGNNIYTKITLRAISSQRSK